jgi:hypothetical protein
VSASIGNSYDFENHLIQRGAITIVYDGDGNRVQKTAGGVTTNNQDRFRVCAPMVRRDRGQAKLSFTLLGPAIRDRDQELNGVGCGLCAADASGAYGHYRELLRCGVRSSAADQDCDEEGTQQQER